MALPPEIWCLVVFIIVILDFFNSCGLMLHVNNLFALVNVHIYQPPRKTELLKAKYYVRRRFVSCVEVARYVDSY